MSYIDFKITTWKRLEVTEEQAKELKKMLASNDTVSVDSFVDENYGNIMSVDDTDEQMTVEENCNNHTIELYEDGIFDTVMTNKNELPMTDFFDVHRDLGMDLTEDEILNSMQYYDKYSENDNTAGWSQIVEQCLRTVENNR